MSRMTYREFADYVKAGVCEIGHKFTEPDDDWIVTVCVDHSGDETPHWFCPPDHVVNRDDGMEILGHALSLGVGVTHPTKVALILSTWQVSHSLAEPLPDNEPPPSEHPDRFESLVVIVLDAERTEAWTALIDRHDDAPPSLQPWEVGDDVGGKLIEPLREALR